VGLSLVAPRADGGLSSARPTRVGTPGSEDRLAGHRRPRLWGVFPAGDPVYGGRGSQGAVINSRISGMTARALIRPVTNRIPRVCIDSAASRRRPGNRAGVGAHPSGQVARIVAASTAASAVVCTVIGYGSHDLLGLDPVMHCGPGLFGDGQPLRVRVDVVDVRAVGRRERSGVQPD
jgi:hypothetical protein